MRSPTGRREHVWSPSLSAWIGWGVVILGLFLVRPPSLTATRIGAPVAVAVTAVVAFTDDSSAALIGVTLVQALAATALAWSVPFSLLCAQSVAYGDERRFPLRTPPGLFVGPIPVAVALVGVGVAAGPLMLGDGRWLLGSCVTVVGVALAAAATRSLHVLATRWIVLVPAGVVVVDPMTLAEPVLLTHSSLASLAPAPPRVDPGVDIVDLRLGAVARSLRIDLSSPAALARRPRRRRPLTTTDVTALLVAPVRPDALCDTYTQRQAGRV